MGTVKFQYEASPISLHGRLAQHHEHYKTFQMVRPVKATPMTRGAYNVLRGWSLPANENPIDPGYLVCVPGSRVNVEGYPGYIHWCSKEMFEASYRLTELTFVERLKAEHADLVERLEKLKYFLQGEVFATLPKSQQDLLRLQAIHMNSYWLILETRLADLKAQGRAL